MRSIGSRIRIQSASEVRASLDTFGGGVVANLAGSTPAGVDPAFDYGGMLVDVDGRLAVVETNLVNAEDAHVRQLIQVANLKRQSEEHTAGLYGKQLSVRRVLEGLFGQDRGFEIAAIQGGTPRDLKTLGPQSEQTIDFLRTPAIQLPPMKVDGVVVDMEGLAGGLEQGLVDSRQSGDQLIRARKAADNSAIVRRQAVADFDALFPWAAQTVEGLFRMAGERELADRIRTSRRRVTRRQKVEAEETESEEPSTDAPSSESAESTQPPTDS